MTLHDSTSTWASPLLHDLEEAAFLRYKFMPGKGKGQFSGGRGEKRMQGPGLGVEPRPAWQIREHITSLSFYMFCFLSRNAARNYELDE
jgi:hypothetical protein